MISDTVSNLLSKIKNAYMRSHESVEFPLSKGAVAICKVLASGGYIGDVKTFKPEGKNYKMISFPLLYKDGRPALLGISRVSKPGQRVYTQSKRIRRVLSGFGISVISTSRGVMSSRDAKKRKLGGEIICEVW